MAAAARVCPQCKAEYGTDVLFCPKDGSPLASKQSKTRLTDDDPYLGLTIADQFRVEQLVGIGAMGRVYRAYQKGIERQVAIKVLHRELLRKPNVGARFQREAKVASRLMHPNVVQVLMIGELERTGADVGGEGYLVMEYLDGISLRSALASAGDALPLPRALHIILQVCDAVGEAHAQGVVHRDLKPENVMLVRRGDDRDFVKVLDFGVARIAWADSTVATQAGVIFGTARYISPEGAQGETVTAASDVYSIVTLLFECLAGRTPFDGDNSVAILVKQTTEQPPHLHSIPRSSYVPEPLARIVAQNLAKDPKARCQDARELGRALVEAARKGGLKADDLVMRSTLLGEGRRGHGATLMTSMERTRQLEMNPNLAAQLAGRPGGGKTELIGEGTRASAARTDAPSASAAGMHGPSGGVTETSEAPPQPPLSAAMPSSPPASAIEPSRASAAQPGGPERGGSESGGPEPSGSEPGGSEPSRSEPGRSEPGRSEPGRSEPGRPSGIDPTLADEPADHVRGRLQQSRSDGRLPDTDSVPDIDRPTTGEPAGGAGARLVVIALCFIGGAALALLVAFRLGVFDAPEAGVERYAERARAALAKSAIDAPPGENVRDITDAALQKWPDNANLLEIRRDAAHRLVVRAQLIASDNAEEAERLAALALDLDPASSDARRILEGDDPKPAPDMPEAETTAVPSESSPPPRTRSTPRRPPPPPASAAPDVGDEAAADADAGEDEEPPKSGGRWL